MPQSLHPFKLVAGSKTSVVVRFDDSPLETNIAPETLGIHEFIFSEGQVQAVSFGVMCIKGCFVIAEPRQKLAKVRHWIWSHVGCIVSSYTPLDNETSDFNFAIHFRSCTGRCQNSPNDICSGYVTTSWAPKKSFLIWVQF